ncbi:HAD family hydrolase [Chitinophaga sp. Cy-1792]|uniref:HAD family hydrolase n=1 Tax=Chitinophaga sp. Cy-1792 TaxID=2608339 RepID=UPI00141D86DD|nr:HAD family hydrolase [Chitinophaga sp. Cy-1792]NIG54673.1 HAD family hydrolase [Chitinophaga sp. Cy-1792]
MKTLILDFDGTIADTRSSIIKTVQLTAKELGLGNIRDEDVQYLIGLPIRETFIKALGITDEVSLDKAIGIYRAHYNPISAGMVVLYPNVKNTLQSLFSKGISITVASSKGKEALQVLLEKLEISAYIALVFGEQDVENKKPAPDMVLRILEITKTQPEAALVVGDTIFDIEMGQRAGCATCGVTYGNHSETQLREQGATFLINDFKKLIDFF